MRLRGTHGHPFRRRALGPSCLIGLRVATLASAGADEFVLCSVVGTLPGSSLGQWNAAEGTAAHSRATLSRGVPARVAL